MGLAEVLCFSETLLSGLVINMCACYHRQKPLNDISMSRPLLFDNITALLEGDPDNVFMLAADLNGLRTTYLHTHFGLQLCVNT